MMSQKLVKLISRIIIGVLVALMLLRDRKSVV